MKKLIAVLAVVLAILAVGLVEIGEANHRHHHHHGGFWTGFAVGTFSGVLVGPSLYQPRYYYPSPTYYLVPPPSCFLVFTTGYWVNVPVAQDGGFITYRQQWIPSSSQIVCE